MWKKFKDVDPWILTKRVGKAQLAGFPNVWVNGSLEWDAGMQ